MAVIAWASLHWQGREPRATSCAVSQSPGLHLVPIRRPGYRSVGRTRLNRDAGSIRYTKLAPGRPREPV
jgi:hypothetical protein